MRIDVHQHFVPPEYADWLSRSGVRPGGLELPSWSRSGALNEMDRQHIGRAVLSLSTPGVYIGDGRDARARARQFNEYAADLVSRTPDRFGFFATLTLPDVEGSLAELDYAFDHLGADGVVLLANAQGRYLGDAGFRPLLAELDRRRAAVFVHPGELPGPAAPGVPGFAADFLLDTTRTALSLILSGAMEKYPRIAFILAHAGGFLPYISYRLMLTMSQDPWSAASVFLARNAVELADDRLSVLRRFYYDTALSTSPATLAALTRIADPHRILFGSDWPFAPSAAVSFIGSGLDAGIEPGLFRDAVEHDNAAALFARAG
jgi:predicted TIM-barrel fold metal-dependent hydrolase